MKKQRFLIVALLIIMMASMFSGCAVNALVPTVTEGRFSFSISYEIDGEAKSYHGVYVCQYTGVSVSVYRNSREWESYVENVDGSGDLPILTNDDGVVYINLGFNAEYFMADPDYAHLEAPTPSLYIVYCDNPENYSVDSNVDFMEKYGVRILDYTYPQPIENSYESKWTIGRLNPSIN